METGHCLKPLPRMALLAALLPALTGCPEGQGPAYWVVNDTRRTITVTDESGQQAQVPPGAKFGLGAPNPPRCADGVRAETAGGRLLAQVDDVCDGDVWTVHGPDDASLED
jgi:RNase P/RNase MRP subunit p29